MKAYRAAAGLLVIAGLGFTASPAFARWAPHPRRTEVNGRLWNQNQRIRAGVHDGQLTPTEAH